jgi:hypothetical protein
MVYQPIENYGIIGDMHSVALVVMDGSISFQIYKTPRAEIPHTANRQLSRFAP